MSPSSRRSNHDVARRSVRKVCDRMEARTPDNGTIVTVPGARRFAPGLEAHTQDKEASLAFVEARSKMIAVDSHGPHHFAVEVREGIYATACNLIVVEGVSGRHGNPGEDLPSCHDCQTLNGEEVRARIAAYERKKEAAE